MNITPYNPVRVFEDFMERFNWPMMRENGLEMMTKADWMPSVDIGETDKEYLIKVEVPEVKKEDIKIQVDGGMLCISGERRDEITDKKNHRVERFYGTFSRSFTLPDDVAEKDIEAEQKDGMLYLHLKKSEQKQPKAVEVKVH